MKYIELTKEARKAGLIRPRPCRDSLIEASVKVLSENYKAHLKMTVRQIYYQLVAKQIIENHRLEYKRIVEAVVAARKRGDVDWVRIEDRTRQPIQVSMWDGITDFGMTAVEQYRRNIWPGQSCYVEVWLEKAALAGIFEEILDPYGITLNVGRGNDSWDSIRNIAERFLAQDKHNPVLIFFSDFDPTGEDMRRDVAERLEYFGCRPKLIIGGLRKGDIKRYRLPPDFAKKTDSRYRKFVEKYGEDVVELDALPASKLKVRIEREVEKRMDLEALKETNKQGLQDQDRLTEIFEEIT